MAEQRKKPMREAVLVPLKPIAVSLAMAQQLTGIAETSLFEKVSVGELPARKWGSRTVILLRDLEKFMESLPARPITRAAKPSPVADEQAG